MRKVFRTGGAFVSGFSCRYTHIADGRQEPERLDGAWPPSHALHGVGPGCEGRLIPYNPAIGCCLPPEEEKEMDILPAEQIGACLSEAEKHGVNGHNRGDFLFLCKKIVIQNP